MCGRVLDVVEVAEGECDVERAFERRRQEIGLHELDLVAEALQARPGQVQHRVGEVDVDVARRAVLERELSDARGAAADVEHARSVVLAHDVERELPPVEEARPQRALERVLLVVQRVKRERLRAKVLAYASRAARRCLRRLAHS